MAGLPQKLRKRPEFLRVASRGRKVATSGLVLQVLKTEDEAPARVGYTVTKKVGNAVVRNRTRRRLRAALAHVAQDHALSAVDLVLIGRDSTRGRPFGKLLADLEHALKKGQAL
ncbi:ribonuclease P protein component [Asaia sp. As-1742]|uniref:ribonuclease P protein component n=1 Tax=Asaia sp. As-1742 TaxID=2608325 RepID=UPI00142434B8|nr:ribonuclease P protein component [Asaia sp. As-1742]NIE78915.1 ribonuclease P protein component [Asaia sp. As-1742]